MNEIEEEHDIGYVLCKHGSWSITIRKNHLIEIDSIDGAAPVNVSVVLNYADIKDFQNLSRLFSEAALFFEEEERRNQKTKESQK